VIFGVVRRNPGADAIERTPNDARYFAGFYKTTRPADSRS
jgi:hypothetical protein